MNKKILIVEDEFIVANDLRLILTRAGYEVCGVAGSVSKAWEIVEQEQPTLVLLDIYLEGEGSGIDLARRLRERHIAFVYLSANSNQEILEAARQTQPYGFLVKPFREKDVLVTLDIARYRREHSLEAKLQQELLLQQQLSTLAASALQGTALAEEFARILQPHIPFDFLQLADEGQCRDVATLRGCLRVGFDEYQAISLQQLTILTGLSKDALAAMVDHDPQDRLPATYNNAAFERRCRQSKWQKLLADNFYLRSQMIWPVLLGNGHFFFLFFYSREAAGFGAEHLALAARLQPDLRKVVQNRPPVQASGGDRTRTMEGFEGIIGRHPSLLQVFDHVRQVAPLDTSVLIQGESGTGKERIARCIHELSARRKQPLVQVNCAALPPTLIESELFGHEKGAFTGAIGKRTGKFEQAGGGTIFLDEIGEMPLEVQAKLLRVLQEKEIERVGGHTPVKTDVRVLAATNRHLEKEVAEGRFRLDLYYRLNIFPLQLPSLRERRTDIQELANHFATLFCKKINKPFNGIAPVMMEQMEAYDWPGNIRELENIIQQSVIMSAGSGPLELMRPLDPGPGARPVHSYMDVKMAQQETERTYLLSVLKKVKGKIRGTDGAAHLLNLKPTTLESRMARLGIRKEELQ